MRVKPHRFLKDIHFDFQGIEVVQVLRLIRNKIDLMYVRGAVPLLDRDLQSDK